jgi:hypothetical protein
MWKILITRFITRLTQRVPLVEHELLTIPEHLSTSSVFSMIRVTRSLVLYVCFIDRCLTFRLITSLNITPPSFIGAPVSNQESDCSTCVLDVLILQLSLRLWKCSGTVVFFSFKFIIKVIQTYSEQLIL